MIYVLLAASSIATGVTFFYWRSIARAPSLEGNRLAIASDTERNARARKVAAGLMEFLVPFTISAFFYSVLSAWLSIQSGASASSTIGEFERQIALLRRTYIAPIHLSNRNQLMAAAGLVLAGFLWPRIREYGVFERFKATTRWIGRAYMLTTCLASFTFFGTLHATNARATEVRLTKAVDDIERVYGDYEKQLAAAVEAQTAAEIVSSAAYQAAVSDLRDTAELFNEERRVMRAGIQDFERMRPIELHELPIPRRAEPVERIRLPERPKEHSRRSDGREMWTQQQGRALRVQAQELHAVSRRQLLEVGKVTEAGLDLTQEYAGQKLAAAVLGDSPAAGLLKLVLDPNVLYAFRDLVSDRVDAIFRSSVTRSPDVRELVRASFAATRARAETLARSSAVHFGRAVTACQALWRTSVQEARTWRRTLPSAVETAIALQYERDIRDLRARAFAHYEFPDAQTTALVRELLERLLNQTATARSSRERIARVRSLRTELYLQPEYAVSAISRFVALEENTFPGDRRFTRAMDRHATAIIAREQSTKWGSLRERARNWYATVSVGDRSKKPLHSGMTAWVAERQRLARGYAASGAHLDAEQWERAFHAFCERNTETLVAFGWAVKNAYPGVILEKYGAAKPITGYAYYLAERGVGGMDDAEKLFYTGEAIVLVGTACGGESADTTELLNILGY